jgi:ABC-type uncharacterized transport system auxiliary subunit
MRRFRLSPKRATNPTTMKKLICILACAGLLGACEHKETVVTPAPADKKTENNTTVVNPATEKKETKETTNTLTTNPSSNSSSSSTSTTTTDSSPKP